MTRAAEQGEAARQTRARMAGEAPAGSSADRRPGSPTRGGRARTHYRSGVRFARALGALGRLMIRVGVLILLLVVYQLWGTGIHTSEAQDNLRKQFAAEQQALARRRPPIDPPRTATTPTTTPIKVAADGSIAGAQARPAHRQHRHPADRLELHHGRGRRPQVPVRGTRATSPARPCPGQAGNAAVAGHRTTYKAPFNRIDELQPGDDIFVTTLQGKFTYQVMAQAPRPSRRADARPPRS